MEAFDYPGVFMMLRYLRRAGQAGLLALATLLAACGGGSDPASGSRGVTGGQSSSGLGQLAISITDSQGCNYRSVWVTVEQVRVHQSSTADDGDGGWRELNLTPARRIDLLTLRNGVFVDLGKVEELPTGKYARVRLVLAENGSKAPFANQLDLADGTEVALKTPSAQQSGLKLKVDVDVEPGGIGRLVLDFDPCRSVVRAGNSGKYLLKPVIRAYVNPTNDIEGYTVPGAIVSAQQGGVSLKSTTADGRGKFVLWPVDAGSYDVVITSPGLANAVLTGVQVSAGRTTVSVQGTPLVPGPSPTFRQVSGTVSVTSPGTNLIDADLRALQYVGTYPASAVPLLIEAAATTADADLGSYAFSLPTAAPQRAAWQSGVTNYNFTPVAGEAGRYTIEARAAGFVAPKFQPANIGSASDSGVDFAFP
jgi:hypothetical protein